MPTLTLDEVLTLAARDLNAGRLGEARRLCLIVLRRLPEIGQAWQHLGVIERREGRPGVALACLRRAMALDPARADAQINGAIAAQSVGAMGLALTGYRRALLSAPGEPMAAFNRGALRQRLGWIAAAAADYRMAVILDPACVPALVNGGALWRTAGDPSVARRWLERAIRMRGDLAEAHVNLALAFQGDPSLSPEARLEGARAALGRALALAPDFVDGLMNLGAIQRLSGDGEAGFRSLRRALAVQPGHAETLANLGTVSQGAGRVAEALALYDRALALRPDYAEGWYNRGCTVLDGERHREAIADFGRAVLLRPDHHDARRNLGMTALQVGDLATGWPAYEARLADRGKFPRRFDLPRWRGEPLRGRTIVLHAEQGFGDVLQFVRYAPLVVRAGGRVVIEVRRPLARLLRSLPDAASMRIVEWGEPMPACDLECPIMSLPLAFGTTLEDIPAAVPYLGADPADVARRAAVLGVDGSDGPGSDGSGSGRPVRVGFIWAGSATFERDRLRSPRLAAMRPILDVPGVRFFGLQKGDGRRDLEGEEMPEGFTDLGDGLEDFADTAAVMAGLDLVISSCTGPAHLAAAMGVPTWILIPRAADWRWMLEREDSPWYPSVRLFRQAAAGEWGETVERVAAALRGFASEPGT